MRDGPALVSADPAAAAEHRLFGVRRDRVLDTLDATFYSCAVHDAGRARRRAEASAVEC